MPRIRIAVRVALFPAIMFLLALASRAEDEKEKAVSATTYPFVFRDVGDEAGVFPHLAGIRGHAVAWGDVDGDGWPDLFVGTFHDQGSKPGMFLRNDKGKFRLDEQKHLRTSGMGSGALFVDLTNSGRLDLYVSSNAHASAGERSVPSFLFRNDGGGKFADISRQSGACPPGFKGRGAAALDFDGDGLLDLLVCESYYGTQAKHGVALYRNKGGYHFENVADAVGLPTSRAVTSAAVADINGDGWPDVFLVFADGNNRLFLNDGRGKFREAPATAAVFAWKEATADDPPIGVRLADVNGDGLPDVVIGNHFKAPWVRPAPVRLYLHGGVRDGNPTFTDITEAAGLKPLALKAPHVEIQDFDNDGRPDIYVSIVKFKDGKPYPLIFRNLGVRDGLPRFREDAWAVNDFPTAEDKAQKRAGPLFDKILKEKKIMYFAAAPSGDYDRDGRLDLLMANWWVADRSLLLRNETPGGNWLDIRVEGAKGLNRMGIGAVVQVYPSGKLGEPAALLGCREISAGYGYCSGQEAVAHFGLGATETVDLRILLPHGKGAMTRQNVKANQRLMVKP